MLYWPSSWFVPILGAGSGIRGIFHITEEILGAQQRHGRDAIDGLAAEDDDTEDGSEVDGEAGVYQDKQEKRGESAEEHLCDDSLRISENNDQNNH